MTYLRNSIVCFYMMFLPISLGGAQTSESVNAKFNFINEKQEIFFDDFSKDIIGSFPSHWISNISGEVVTVRDYPGNWFKMHANGTYIPQINKTFSENFLIEFDFIYQALGTDNNVTEVTIFTKKPGEPYDAFSPGNHGIKIYLENFIVSFTCYDKQKLNDKMSKEHRTNIIQANKKVKISIEVQNQHLNLYVNNRKLLDVPTCTETHEQFDALRFNLWGSQGEPLIGNFKITSGTVKDQ